MLRPSVRARRDAAGLVRDICFAFGAGLAALIAFRLLAKHRRAARIVLTLPMVVLSILFCLALLDFVLPATL